MESNFDAVFRAHKLRIQKQHGKNPNCHWQSRPTTSTVFDTNTHADLVKLQCQQAALDSYREAQNNLEKLNCQRRSANNHVQIQQLTNQVGERIAQENQTPPSPEELPVAAEELSVQVDGGHIPTKAPDKRSFEALSVIVARPSAIEVVDQHHRQLTDKSCAISALDERQATIKTYLYDAALKQGLSPETQVTALADGAHNCWSAIAMLAPDCATLELILDWFHIGMKFETLKTALGESLADSVERAKWC